MTRLTAAAACLVLAFAPVASADITIDVTPNANLVPFWKSQSPPSLAIGSMSLSKNGRYAAFLSAQSTLVPGVGNGKTQGFVLDTVKKSLRCVTLDANGQEFDDTVEDISISDNGRFLAFSTRASNTGVMFNGFTQVFLQDMKTGKRTLCSRNAAGQAGNLDSDSVEISGNGKVVAFRSRAANLSTVIANGKKQIFTFDVKTEVTEQCSMSAFGGSADSDIDFFAISGDGKVLAFATLAHALLPFGNDAAAYSDVFAFDRATGITSLVSKSTTGQAADGPSYFPSISKDGRYIGFISVAKNLVAGDADGHMDGFFYDRVTDTMTRCDGFQDGVDSLSLGTTTMSNDGRRMVAQSLEYVVVSNGDDFFALTARTFDRATGDTTVTRFGMLESLTENDDIVAPVMTPDGKKMFFTSQSALLAKPQANGSFLYSIALDS